MSDAYTVPTRPDFDVYTVAAYDAAGEEVARLEYPARTAAEACGEAEDDVANGYRTAPGAVEYQAVIRHLSDAEVVAESYQVVPRAECSTCGDTEHVHYGNVGDSAEGDCWCLPCVLSGLEHGRRHVAESFEEELLPSCGYCGNTGHLASACPEQPEEN